MGAKKAWEALTNPKPTNRDELVLWLADRVIKRFRYRSPMAVKEQDVWWLLVVLARWGWLTRREMPSISRHAMGDLVRDIVDVARINAEENGK